MAAFLFLCSDLNGAGGIRLVKERVLAVPYTTVFIAQLPRATKNIIREDLMQHAKENGYHLDWDLEAQDYVGMTRRFCDIDGIYNDTVLKFCEPGEDIEAYEKSIQRNIVLKLPNEDVENLCAKTARAGLTVSQLLENFVYDLVHSDRANGSDERMYANQWFDRCGFSFSFSQTFLVYLIEWGEVDTAIEMWEELEDYKDQGELDEYEKQDVAVLTEALEKMFRDYQEDNKEPADLTLESGMEKVLKWDKERKELLRGNVMEKIMKK
jgi:hypothetical protein